MGHSSGDGGEDGDKDEATAWPDALVDAMLSLLSKTTAPLPSAPLRDAVETVFRNMCGSVTATGEPGFSTTPPYTRVCSVEDPPPLSNLLATIFAPLCISIGNESCLTLTMCCGLVVTPFLSTSHDHVHVIPEMLKDFKGLAR